MPFSHDPVLGHLLANNKKWATDVERSEPGFFEECAKGQSPKVLWIGCSDSRVPESVITACKPGEIFVHRNIANQFHPHDDSASSVLAYAIDELNVSHIIVTGHLRCGGAAACHAAASKPPGPAAVETPLGRWLEPLTAIARERTYTLEELVEVNVKKQVTNITNADTVRNAWKRGQDIWVHGWVYDIPDGRIRDLGVSVGKPGH